MLFNSFEFLVFFTLVYALYRLLRHCFRLQNLLLLVAAFVFYGWWDVRFVYLIALSTALDYSTGLLIGHGKMSWNQRLAVTAWLAVAALVSLAIRWDAVGFSLRSLRLSVDWSLFWTRDRANWLANGCSAIAVLLAHLAYSLLMRLDDPARRKLTLTLSIIAILGLLGFFKYFHFFVDSFRALWSLAFGTTPDL